MKMYELSCGEIWGGIRNCDDDVTSAGLTASIYSFASDGGKGGAFLGFVIHRASLYTVTTVAEIFSTRRAFRATTMLNAVI
jgi:hypothetical protein